MQSTILGRILDGSAGAPASNAIPAILDGLVCPSDMPDGTSTRQWVYPRTGQACLFRLQHAVDYAYVLEGNQPASTALRLSVGPSFCREPRSSGQVIDLETTRRREPSPSHSSTSAEHVISLFAQDDPCGPTPVESPRQSAVQPHAPVVLELTSTPASDIPAIGVPLHAATPGGIGSRQPQTSSPSLDARIMELLLNQPELLARFVQVVTSARSARPATAIPEVEPTRRSKYSFTPTLVQVSLHEAITAPEHRGKAPSIFVEIVVYSTAVRFQTHPGIII